MALGGKSCSPVSVKAADGHTVSERLNFGLGRMFGVDDKHHHGTLPFSIRAYSGICTVEDALIEKIDGDLRMHPRRSAAHHWRPFQSSPMLVCEYCGVLLSYLEHNHVPWYLAVLGVGQRPVWSTIKPPCLAEVEPLTDEQIGLD